MDVYDYIRLQVGWKIVLFYLPPLEICEFVKANGCHAALIPLVNLFKYDDIN